MKTQFAVGLFLLAAVPFISSAAGFETNLKYGNKGQAVTELQEFLISKGNLGGTATGNFYSLTLAAVKKFQLENNLPSTGYFGPMSRAVANQILAADLNASNEDEIVQTGTITPVVTPTPVIVPAVTDNTNAINQLNQKIDTLTNQLQTQQSVGSVAPVVVPVEKKITVDVGIGGSCQANIGSTGGGTICEIRIQYFENNRLVEAPTTVSVNDTRGLLVKGDYSPTVSGRVFIYTYYPSDEGFRTIVSSTNTETGEVTTANLIDRTITVTINGITVTRNFTTRYYTK